MSQPIRTYILPVATMLEYETYVHTTLADGFDQHYHPPLTDPMFLAAAHEMGYSDPMRYAVEHEIAHHLIADRFPDAARVMPVEMLSMAPQGAYSPDGGMGFEYKPVYGICSRIIYNACHDLPQSMDEQESMDEEHLVNRLQRFANLGVGDPYGVLETTCGAILGEFAGSYLAMCRPWLVRPWLVAR